MRRAAAIFAILSATGCHSSVAPTPITLEAKNTLTWDVFVANDRGQGGLTLERPSSSGSATSPVGEGPACACESCSQVCATIDTTGTCTCTVEPNIHRIAAGQSFTRTFAGTEFQATRADCGTGDLGPSCFAAGQPLESGSFLLQLCYAESVPNEQAGNDFNGTFPTDSSVICVTQPFTYPQDTSVVVSTVAPPPCSATSQCPSGQLCQQGVCSASCLSNSVPAYGAQWTDSVQVIQDQGFFTHTNGDPDRLTGTGTVGTVLYNGTDMQLTLVGSAAQGSLAAQVEVMVPTGTPTVPFFTGETLSVLVIEADSTRASSTAIAIRDAQQNLALAVDEGYGGALLSSSDLSPISVDAGGSPFACTLTTLCGKQIYQSMSFTSGNAAAQVEPGQTGTLEVGSISYAATAVADYTDSVTNDSTDCGVNPVAAFAIAQQNRMP